MWGFVFLFIFSLQALSQEANNKPDAFIGDWKNLTCKTTCFELTISNENNQYILEGLLTTSNKDSKTGSFKLKLIDDNTLEIVEIIKDSIGDAEQLIGTQIIREGNNIVFTQPNKKSAFFSLVNKDK